MHDVHLEIEGAREFCRRNLVQRFGLVESLKKGSHYLSAQVIGAKVGVVFTSKIRSFSSTTPFFVGLPKS